jgi:hypothetical protein
MKKLHKALENKINERVALGVFPEKCLLSYKTLTGLAKELPVGKRVIVPFKKLPEHLHTYASKAGILYFKVDNRFKYGNFKIL